ncbi:MAG: hypothetical protein ABFD00_10565 [Chloroherpetonaceae bacterium]
MLKSINYQLIFLMNLLFSPSFLISFDTYPSSIEYNPNCNHPVTHCDFDYLIQFGVEHVKKGVKDWENSIKSLNTQKNRVIYIAIKEVHPNKENLESLISLVQQLGNIEDPGIFICLYYLRWSLWHFDIARYYTNVLNYKSFQVEGCPLTEPTWNQIYESN